MINRQSIIFGVGILIFIAVAFSFMQIKMSAEEQEIKDHFAGHAVSLERSMTTIGSPFWYEHEHGSIYRVRLDDGQVWWVRTGSVFGYDYEKEN
jgi:hypothetical protein